LQEKAQTKNRDTKQSDLIDHNTKAVNSTQRTAKIPMLTGLQMDNSDIKVNRSTNERHTY